MGTDIIVAEMRIPDDNRGELPSFFMRYNAHYGKDFELHSISVSRRPFGNIPGSVVFYYESPSLDLINSIIWQTVAHSQFVYTPAGEKLIKQN